MSASIAEIVNDYRVIVCCGAGGVGKTTTAASIGLAAARAGRRVLVLTIDPSKRLAETMGVSPNETKPHPPPPEFLEAAGIKAPGALEVWMLDPEHISDTAVAQLTGSKEEAQRLLDNRIYKNVTRMVAGMQEYTAMEALHRFISEGTYDLVVLDTPPSRNALNFLEGPTRLGRFFDGRIFQLFIPQDTGLLRQAASKLVTRVLNAVFGESFVSEFQGFLGSFSEIFKTLTKNAERMRSAMSAENVAFLLVTSPAPEALVEAMYFKSQTETMKLPFKAFILNRSHALETQRKEARPEAFAQTLSATQASALEKFKPLGASEKKRAEVHRSLLEKLNSRAGDGAHALALPTLPGGVDDVPGLVTIAKSLMQN